MLKKTVVTGIIFCMLGQNMAFAAPGVKNDIALSWVQKAAVVDLNDIMSRYGDGVKIGGSVAIIGGAIWMGVTLSRRAARIQALERELTETQELLSRTKGSLSNSQGLLSKTNKSLSTTQELLDKTLKLLDIAKKDFAELENKYYEELHAREAMNKSWKEFSDYLQQQLIEKEEMGWQLMEQVEKSDVKVGKLQDEIVKLNTEIFELEEQVLKVKSGELLQMYSEKSREVQSLQDEIAILKERLDISSKQISEVTQLEEQLAVAKKELAEMEKRAVRADELLRSFDNPYRYGKDLITPYGISGREAWDYQVYASAWREEAITNQGIIKTQERKIAELQRQIAELKRTPLSKLENSAFKSEMAQLRAELKGSEAYQDIVLSARKTRTVARDPLSEALLASIEKGDEKEFSEAVTKLLGDGENRGTAVALKNIFNELRTSYVKNGGYDTKFLMKKILPELNQVVKQEVPGTVNVFVVRSVGKSLLKRMGLFGIGVLSIGGLMAFSSPQASAQDKAMAQRLIKNPNFFLEANEKELTEIESNPLSAATALEIAEAIHAATTLNKQQLEELVQAYHQQELYEQTTKNSVQKLFRGVKAR